ncbi:MAG: peptidylprolyl isomerase [Desulfobacterales bacterium]|nr:peptidylprolyl isomerase [Desulfobacterales bacterium]
MKKLNYKTFITLICMILFFCFNNVYFIQNLLYASEIVDKIVAIVNDDIITLSDINQESMPFEKRIKSAGYPSYKENELLKNLHSDMLNKLIDQKITDQEIKKTEIKISDKEVDAYIDRIKEANFMTSEDFVRALSKDNLTVDEYKNQVKGQILRNKLVNYKVKSKIVITKEDIKAYYEKNKNLYAGEKKYHLRHILMKISSFADTDEKKAVLKKMEEIYQKLKEGESFERIAKNYSESPYASKGGDLGFFKIDELLGQIKENVYNLKEGEFTQIIDTEQGYQIFYLEKIENVNKKSFEESSSEIEKKLYDEIVEKTFKSWLSDLRQNSHIKIIK